MAPNIFRTSLSQPNSVKAEVITVDKLRDINQAHKAKKNYIWSGLRNGEKASTSQGAIVTDNSEKVAKAAKVANLTVLDTISTKLKEILAEYNRMRGRFGADKAAFTRNDFDPPETLIKLLENAVNIKRKDLGGDIIGSPVEGSARVLNPESQSFVNIATDLPLPATVGYGETGQEQTSEKAFKDMINFYREKFAEDFNALTPEFLITLKSPGKLNDLFKGILSNAIEYYDRAVYSTGVDTIPFKSALGDFIAEYKQRAKDMADGIVTMDYTQVKTTPLSEFAAKVMADDTIDDAEKKARIAQFKVDGVDVYAAAPALVTTPKDRILEFKAKVDADTSLNKAQKRAAMKQFRADGIDTYAATTAGTPPPVTATTAGTPPPTTATTAGTPPPITTGVTPTASASVSPSTVLPHTTLATPPSPPMIVRKKVIAPTMFDGEDLSKLTQAEVDADRAKYEAMLNKAIGEKNKGATLTLGNLLMDKTAFYQLSNDIASWDVPKNLQHLFAKPIASTASSGVGPSIAATTPASPNQIKKSVMTARNALFLPRYTDLATAVGVENLKKIIADLSDNDVYYLTVKGSADNRAQVKANIAKEVAKLLNPTAVDILNYPVASKMSATDFIQKEKDSYGTSYYEMLNGKAHNLDPSDVEKLYYNPSSA